MSKKKQTKKTVLSFTLFEKILTLEKNADTRTRENIKTQTAAFYESVALVTLPFVGKNRQNVYSNNNN